MTEQRIKIAAVQATPVFLDRDATLEKACALIARAGEEGAHLAVFPEAFIPSYPLWSWFIPPLKTHLLRALYSELASNAVTVPGTDTERLCRAAREAGVDVVIGVNELDGTGTSRATLYNTLVFISAKGGFLGKHRKLIPTVADRSVWGRGDGSSLRVYETGAGRVGGLICWENYMPLVRHTLYASGIQILATPTWDRGEPWLSTLRHIGKEGRVFVVGACSPVHRSDIPDRFEFKSEFLPDTLEWVNPGLSVIVDPDGKVIAGPVENDETILYADFDRSAFSGPRFQLDVAGHYSRPDIFRLLVDRRTHEQVSEMEAGELQASDGAEPVSVNGGGEGRPGTRD